MCKCLKHNVLYLDYCYTSQVMISLADQGPLILEKEQQNRLENHNQCTCVFHVVNVPVLLLLSIELFG